MAESTPFDIDHTISVPPLEEQSLSCCGLKTFVAALVCAQSLQLVIVVAQLWNPRDLRERGGRRDKDGKFFS